MSPLRFRRQVACRFVLALSVAAALGAGTTMLAQIPGRNVNMVAGTEWPGGDPYLQRQNEGSIGASTRNPLHLLGGSNDYRTVDVPGLPDGVETGDAWLSVYKSFDGGQRWSSTLLPGYPQDTSAAGTASPIKGYQAAADPVVRAGTHGLFYYNGLVFDRGEGGRSAIFVTRFIDRNNKENGDPIAYLGTNLVATSSGDEFLDKPWMAVDLPRGGSPALCVVGGTPDGGAVRRNGHRQRGNGQGRGNQPPADGLHRVPAGAVYVVYSSITGDGATLRSEIFLKRSMDCGVTWSPRIRVSRPTDRINQGATLAIEPQTGHVFVSWRRFASPEAPDTDAIMVARLPVGGSAFDAPGLARGLRRAGPPSQQLDKIFEHRKKRAGTTEVADLSQLDQGTTTTRFRTNAYPAMAIDGERRLYVAWTERGFAAARPNAVDGDARILVATSTDGRTFSAPVVVDDDAQLGHQLMPTLTFAGGRLLLVFYDLRDTAAQVAARFISDSDSTNGLRHTIDIRAALGTPGEQPAFAPSVRVSDYMMGYRSGTSVLEQLQVNPPNLPMFKGGTVPFLGDYIDVTAAPAFVPAGGGRWAYNTAPGAEFPTFHAVWTDNRDVRPPLDSNWTNYRPPTADGMTSGKSLFDPSQDVLTCQAGNAGSRNQNIYTARIGGGLMVGAPGNAKPLSPNVQRGFVVFAQNQTTVTKTFRMTVLAQPAGGRASFEQFPLPPYTASSPAPLRVLDVRVPPRSTASRTLYVTATDPRGQVTVDVREVTGVGGSTVAGGLEGRVLLNPDIENPDIENPDIENPDIENPDIENSEVYNPDIENPDIENPDIENPDIENPDIENPDIENVVVANPDIENLNIANPDIENPDIENPDIENPDIENPDIENGAIADVTWTVSNVGNTTTAFNVNLFLASAAVPAGVKTQLIVYKTYKTPVLAPNGCDLRVETRNILLFNRPNPDFVTPGEGLPSQNDPSDSNATLWLAPGELGRVTLRVFDDDTSNNLIFTNLDGSTASIDPALNPATSVTAGIAAQGLDARDPAGATVPPVITTAGTNLVYLQQPTNVVPGTVMAPPVRVRVWDNSGAPLPGVTVTMTLLNAPPGAELTGTAAVSDAAGVATFGGLSVNVLATGLRLRATATSPGVVAAGTSAPFNVVSPLPPYAVWSSAGSGTVTTLNDGITGQPAMQYQHSGANDFRGAWQFSTVAAGTRTVDLAYVWDGFHSYFQVTAELDLFVSRNGNDVSVVTLLDEGPTDCDPCQPPSGGFIYRGATSVQVQAGDTYGFRLRGSHGDIADTLQGTFTVAVDGAPYIGSATPSTIGAGQMIVLRGANMPATAASGILFSQDGNDDLPASYTFYQPSSDLVIARSPAGLVPGSATVRATNGDTSTPPFPITIGEVAGAPVLTALLASCDGPNISAVSPGQQVFVLADGVDTAGTTFVWTSTASEAGSPVTNVSNFTTEGPGSICTATMVPTGLGGPYSLQIWTRVNGVDSARSNAIPVQVVVQ